MALSNYLRVLGLGSALPRGTLLCARGGEGVGLGGGAGRETLSVCGGRLWHGCRRRLGLRVPRHQARRGIQDLAGEALQPVRKKKTKLMGV